LFTKFNQKYKTIFLDSSSTAFDLEEKVNIVLSPSMYWVKKLSLPLQKASEVKKLLESIFEDSLPLGNYNYSVYKEGDFFFAFAYDDKFIIDTLEAKGITVANVAGVYFAQSELGFIEGAVKINETQSIFLKDDILILLPCCWVEESGDLNIDEVTLSKRGINLEQFGHLVDTKSLYKIGAILVAFIILIMSEWIITSSKVDGFNDKKETLFEKAKLQATMFQNKAMLKKYTNVHSKQVSIREITSIVLSTRLKASETLTHLTLKDKKITAQYNLISQPTINAIKKELKREKIEFNIDKKNGHFIFEMML